MPTYGTLFSKTDLKSYKKNIVQLITIIMKIIKKQIKTIALILSMLILFQGCTVYKSANVSLDQASKADIKTKVSTKDGEKLKFERIGVEDEKYYGVRKVKGELIKVPLNEDYIEYVKLKDKTTSTILTIALPVAIIVGAVLICHDCFRRGNNHEIIFPPIYW